LLALILALLAPLTLAQQPEPITPLSADRLTLMGQYGMGAMEDFDLSADGTRFAAAMGVGGVRIYDPADLSTPLLVVGSLNADARAVSVSDDGSQVAVGYGSWGDEAGQIAIYETTLGGLVTTLPGHGGDTVSSLDFSGDGLYLASGGWDDFMRVWEVASGAEVFAAEVGFFGAESLVFSPDGTRIAAGYSVVRLFDLSGALVAEMNDHTNNIFQMVFSPDSSTLFSASFDGVLRAWDAATGAPLWVAEGFSITPQGLTFAPDAPGQLIGVADSAFRRWDITTGAEVSNVATDLLPTELFALPDGRFLGASAFIGMSLFGADLTAQPLITDMRTPINTLALAPDGRLALGYRTGEIDLVSPLAGETETLLPTDPVAGGVNDLAYTPDGAYLVISYSRRVLRVYETAGYTLVSEVPLSNSAARLTISAEGGRVGTAGSLTAVYSLPDLALLADLTPSDYTDALSFSPDGSRIAVAWRGGGVLMWDGATYTPLETITSGEERAEQLAFTPDGTGLVVSWSDRFLTLHDPADGSLVRSRDLESNIATALAYSPDGSILAFGDFRDLLLVDWPTLDTFTLQERLFEGRVLDVAFNRSATRLYTLSNDAVVRVWGIE
jgi:WD40 repeat protein